MQVVLRTGSRGLDVAKLQVGLDIWGVPGEDLVVDGIFGPRTQQAVIAFQRKSHLRTDGVVGPDTQAALAKVAKLTSVVHPLQQLAQPTQTTCWATSTAMMIGSNVAAVRARTTPDMVADDGGLRNSSESDQGIVSGMRYGALFNLRCYAPMSWTVRALLDRLRRGPLMFDMLWNAMEYAQGHASPGHMIVVVGYITDDKPDGSGTYLLIHDPWPPLVGKKYWVEFSDWIAQVPTRTYRVFERL